jgi:phycobilisome core-membrane linker protein
MNSHPTYHANGGSPVVHPQQYSTVPKAIISQAEQQDRSLQKSELTALANYFRSGSKLIQIAATLTQHSDAIVEAAAHRIFYGGVPMAYLEPPANRKDLPGYSKPSRQRFVTSQEALKVQAPKFGNSLGNFLAFWKTQFSADREPMPEGFRPINIGRYGPTRMKRSMRDLSWFLRYVTYAIVAGDSSILVANAQGLRGVIPEDVTEATVVAIKEMRWRSLGYFKTDPEATAIIQQHFDDLVAAYTVEKPSTLLRQGFSNDQQGLQLPESYALSSVSQSKFVMKSGQAVTEQNRVIQAAYRQVFERDITREYGISLMDLESKLKGGEISMKEFIRRVGKSRLYRKEFYEPFTISRVIELAIRHFLGRGLRSPEEFQQYFELMAQTGLPALVDKLVDSQEYADYFGEETVPYLRGLGQEAQECRNWGPQAALFKYSTLAHKVPQFITLFGDYRKPLPNQHPYGLGNDPLEIQFGAIFPHQDRNFDEHPALFDPDSRRILIGCNVSSRSPHETTWGQVPGSTQRVLKLDCPIRLNGHGNGKSVAQGASINLNNQSMSAFIDAAYRQLFGRDILVSQRVPTTELKLKSGEIPVREFVRQVAKSRLFRHLYWDALYVTKAVEYIHRRLLGRPTYGRQETLRYYDICARKGFYALIDSILDSPEYLNAFGEDTVPYERYVTPRGYEMRSHHRESSSNNSSVGQPRVADGTWVKAALQRAGHLRQDGLLALLPGAEPAMLLPAREPNSLPESEGEHLVTAIPASVVEDPATLSTASAQPSTAMQSDSYGSVAL